MKIIDGRTMAAAIREEVKRDVADMTTTPALGVILLGDDPASRVYVNLKEKAAAEVGIRTDIRRLPEQTTDDELVRIIETWNADPAINGIMVQIPLPDGHNPDRVIAAIDPKKDVDGFHPENIAALLRGEATILSPVHEAALRLIGATGIDPRTSSATIIANSETFAAPLIHVLKRAGFTTALQFPQALDEEIIRTSNVIMTAVGRPGLLGADLVAPGTVIIDIGTCRGDDGKVRGDANASAFAGMDGWITPVPGGVGPMTVALLLKNVVRAANAQSNVVVKS